MQIIVLGMHRSGTSAVARLLNMMGAYFAPEKGIAADRFALPPTDANPKGYWERWDVVNFNEDVFRALDIEWDKVSEFELNHITPATIDSLSLPLREMVANLDANRPWMIKDPRLCLTLPVWLSQLEVPVCVLVHRSPIQIAQSLRTREGFSLQFGLALWEKYALSMLNVSSNLPRILVSYHDLMQSPTDTLQKLYNDLCALEVQGLRMPSRREILAFLDKDMHREHGSADLQAEFINQQQTELLKAIEDGSVLQQSSLPPLSAGAAEALHDYEVHLARIQTLNTELDIAQQATATAQQQVEAAQQQAAAAQQQAEQAAQQAATREASLSQSLAQKTVENERLQQRIREESTQQKIHAQQLKSESQNAQKLLKTAKNERSQLVGQITTLRDRLQKREHEVYKLIQWLMSLQVDVNAVFRSLTWRSGDLFTRTALTLMLRKPTATAQDHIALTLNEINHWGAQNYPALVQPVLSSTQHVQQPAPLAEVSSESAPRKAVVHQPTVSRADEKKHDPNDYARWFTAYDTISKKNLKEMQERITQWHSKPTISIVMPTWNTNEKLLKAAIESVRNQIYSDWELCIADDASTAKHIRPLLEQYADKDKRIKIIFREKNGHISAASNSALTLVTGDFVTFLDHDDLLPPHALFWVAYHITDRPNVCLLYSDEDKINERAERHSPYFKPDWNPELLRCYNYLNHLTIYKAECIQDAGGFREGFEGAQDYDLLLRVTEKLNAADIFHIPHVLYHWREVAGSTATHGDEKPYAFIAGQKAVREHLQRLGWKGEVLEATELSGALRIRYEIPAPPPLVSIIIPTYNGLDLLSQCVESVIALTTYKNHEIIIVDNRSDDPATLDYMSNLEAEGKAIIVHYPQPFNYSAINNAAVKKANGELLCLMNNDIEIIAECWLEEMVSYALRPDVGAVGARLWYPDQTLQHGGVITGLGGVAGHSHKYLRRGDPGYFGRAVLTQNLTAVTGACLMVRKSVYESLDGLDAENLGTAFNDVDFCLRVWESGLRNVWTPYAEMYHHESASRGADDTPEKAARFKRECGYIRQRWGYMLQFDPAYNPNLTIISEDFVLAWPPRTSAIHLEAKPQKIEELPHPPHRLPGYKNLQGSGLEIGAFILPSPLPESCKVAYADLYSQQDLLYYFPEVKMEHVQAPDHVLDLDKDGLSAFGDESQDFVILNQVIEHVANPLNVLNEVFRIVRQGGHVVISAVDRLYTPHVERLLTPFEALQDRYENSVTEVPDEAYKELLGVAHPEILNLSDNEIRMHISNLRTRRETCTVWDSIHFADFMDRAFTLLGIQAESLYISDGDDNRLEYFSVWRKM